MSDAVVTASYPKEIAGAIANIMGEDLYVQKRGVNDFHRYKFATVGDLLDKLQPLMAKEGLVVFQDEVNRELIDNGNVMTIRYEFTLAHKTGAVWPEKPAHTGMSSCRNSKGGFDDKAANKCHTAARKYFLLGLFQVPTGEDYREGAHDGDADSGDHAPPPPRPQTNGATRSVAAPPPPEKPQHLASNGKTMPPHPEESGEATAARQRIPMLVSKIKQLIETAPDDHRLDVTWDGDELKAELAEIEQAPHAGTSKATGKAFTGFEAANQLRALYNQRIADLRNA